MLKEMLSALLPKNIIKEIKNNYFGGYSLRSYSQEGEDIILSRLFENQQKGFYVDVGAHHPKRFSNTYFFYQKRWSGINIDAMPGSMKLFNKMRPRDKNIEQAISDKKQILRYYAFNEPALNGFSKELAEDRDGKGNYFVEYTQDIETSTLKAVLDKELPVDQKIDFLSIDVEGLDFIVLKSNDFNKYKPSVILVEMLRESLTDIKGNEISEYLLQYNYLPYAKTVNTVIFINDSFYAEK